MTIRVYNSGDTGSPGQINNVAGQLIGVLDVLVNGYSLGTVSSITRSGSTATLTFSAAHGMAVGSKGNRITIAGATQTEYNGEYLVTVTTTAAVTYTVTGTPATPATGTITATKAGCGWTKPYTGTNLAAYKQGASSNGFYLYVDDTGTTSARAIGYETMASISDTSGAAFPTTAQFSGGLHLPKSNSSTTREWIIVATETYVYVWVNNQGSTTLQTMWFFGDFVSEVTADAFNTLFCAATSVASTTGNGVAAVTASVSTFLAGHFVVRTADQTGASVTAGKHINYAASKLATYAGANGIAYPSLSGDLKLSQVFIHENTLADVRGAMPCLLAPLHSKPLTHLDTFIGAGAYAGNVYLALDTYISGQVFLQVE